MRTIETRILQTFKNSCLEENNGETKTFNLSVRDSITETKNNVSYFLWGNRVFWLDRETKTFCFSFCGYNTVTTKSRLNAFFNFYQFGGFYQKNFELYFVSSDRKYKVKIDTSKEYRIVSEVGNVRIESF